MRYHLRKVKVISSHASSAAVCLPFDAADTATPAALFLPHPARLLLLSFSLHVLYLRYHKMTRAHVLVKLTHPAAGSGQKYQVIVRR